MYFMDYNRFNGSPEDLKKFIGDTKTPLLCPIDSKPCPRLTVLEAPSAACLDHEIRHQYLN
jgi:hypothetical protein